MYKFLVFAFLVSLAAGKVLDNYKVCGGNSAVKSIEVDPCESEPCTVKPGDVVDIKVTGTAGSDADDIILELKVLVSGLWISYPEVDGSEACGTNIQCPVKNGEEVVFTSQLTISDAFPPMETTSRWRLVSGDGTVLICVEAPVNISS